MKVMTAAPAEANLSDLLNKPKATLARLAGNRRLVLHRRDAEDLVITTAERAAADNAVVRDTTRLFREMIRKDPMVMTLAVQVLPAVFPWERRSKGWSPRGGTRLRSSPTLSCTHSRRANTPMPTTTAQCLPRREPSESQARGSGRSSAWSR